MWAALWVWLYLVFICTRRVDPDYGWHYRSGQYIWQHGVPAHDIFSYTAAGFPWVNHEWLSDVLTYLMAHFLGFATLGWLFATIWAAAVVLAVKRPRLEWVAAGLALGALLQYVGVRPVAWTALGLALTLRVIDGRRQRYWLLVPLLAVWANVHAGFAVGLVMIGLAAAWNRSRLLALWGAAAAMATLLNPYGWGVYVELARTMGDAKLGHQIAEWAPLSFNRAAAPYLVASVVLLISARAWNYRRVAGAGLVAATIWSGRQLPVMVVATLDLMNREIASGWAWLHSQRPRVATSTRWVAGALVGVLYPLLLLIWPPPVAASLRLARPAAELLALKQQPCSGRVFNDYNYGGLMIEFLPGVPVYIDGRMPSWSGPRGRYLDLYAQVLKDGRFADREFARYGVKCALISRDDSDLSAHLAHSPGWRRVLKADDAELWRRD